MERLKPPNKGLISPPGGKLKIKDGESPMQCAVREANEECGVISNSKEWKLVGIITEKEYPGIGNIIIFCFMYQKRITKLPKNIREGRFLFINPKNLNKFKLPNTDKLFFPKFVLKGSNRLFNIRIDCSNLDKLMLIDE